MCLAIDSTVCFREKTGPCKPTVIQTWAGVEIPPFPKKQNALTVSGFAWLKRLLNNPVKHDRISTAVIEQIPRTNGRVLKERYPDEAALRWFEDGPGHD
jgi:hypothetical protein